MRPIDADALKHMVESMNFAQPFMDVTRVLYGVGIEIDNAPTIDVVEVVRCKECKYRQQCRKTVEHITHEPTSVTIEGKPIDFCSYGEREGE